MIKKSEERMYVAIDLKSFYASCECADRGLDPLTTNLVVADASRTNKTICLAVSPSLKAYGIPGRPRLFEVVRKARQLNLDFITATPRMARYIEVSTKIYNVYLKYVSPEDIHVYSIDEVFIDVTDYLNTYKMTARALAMKMIKDVLDETSITATAGIGTNLYLCKIAMDIVAKHAKADENGVRIAQLDEMEYRRLLWNHRPLTDFWRVGRGYAKKLEKCGLLTMGDIARCSLGEPKDFYNEDLLYKMFGVNAELLIDHAWGYEPCTMADIKAYKPNDSSLGSGQVLQCGYTNEKARIIVREMTDKLILDLVDKGLVTDQIILTIGYDIDNLIDDKIKSKYKGEITIDHYGREVPKAAHGTANMDRKTSSTKIIMNKVMELFDRVVDPNLLIRRVNIAANHITDEEKASEEPAARQMDLFSLMEDEPSCEKDDSESERNLQEAMINIQKKFGKSSILKGTNLEEGATMLERNKQIGGHKA